MFSYQFWKLISVFKDLKVNNFRNLWIIFYVLRCHWNRQGEWESHGRANRFACSWDLVNWTTWKGEDLVSPSGEYDNKYAHKPFVIKHKGVVYHYYCAVDNNGNLGIAVATSKNLGKSDLRFSNE
jgi:hypothetical protein